MPVKLLSVGLKMRKERGECTELVSAAFESEELIGVRIGVYINDRAVCLHYLKVHYVVADESVLAAEEAEASSEA